MAQTASPTGSTLSMKLWVDTKAQRVLYAEADKDVVDFLFSLLTLPVGVVYKILGTDSMVGSIGKLYGSVEKLDLTYLLSADTKKEVLSPAGDYACAKLLQLPAPAPIVLYRCSSNSSDCQNFVTKAYGTYCPGNYVSCSHKMTAQMNLLGSSVVPSAHARGFVQGVMTYTVMDDLKVAPMSTNLWITRLKTFGIKDIGSLQEKTVPLGDTEGLKILKASLQSETVLTDVFLGK